MIHPVSRQLGLSVAAAALSLCMAACGDDMDWKEDVRLADGGVVTLTRHQEWRGPSELFQKPTESDHWFEYMDPDLQRIVRWQSDRTLFAVALLKDGPTPRLLAIPQFNGRFKFDCPDPLYLLFRFDGKEWIREPLKNAPRIAIQPNMTYNTFDAREVVKRRDHLTVAETLNYTPPWFEGRNIDFRLFTVQTFGMRCDPPFDWLLPPRQSRQR